MLDTVERAARALERAMGGVGPPGRDASAAILARRIGRDRRTMDLRHGLRRGRCARRSCPSRYAAVRVIVDTRDPERTDRSAVLECALCGRIWGAVAVPDLRLGSGRLPRVLLTLILPPGRGDGLRIGHNRAGRALRYGDDARMVIEATYRDLAEALREWRERSGRVLGRVERARTQQAVEAAFDLAEHRERMAEIEVARAQRLRLADLEATIAAARGEAPMAD